MITLRPADLVVIFNVPTDIALIKKKNKINKYPKYNKIKSPNEPFSDSRCIKTKKNKEKRSIVTQ